MEHRIYPRQKMNDIFPAIPDGNNSLRAPALHTYLTLMQSVSHEIRSTFGVISGLHSLLPLTSGENERHEMFHRLQNNTEYATQLFTDLEDYCAVETGQVRVEPSLFKPSIALESVQKKMLPMLKRRKATIILTGNSDMPVVGDEEKIRRIVRNIVFHLTCVMRVQEVEMGWEKRGNNWSINAAYKGGALPEWLFMAGDMPDDPAIGRHIALLVVRRLVAVLGGSICGGATHADGLRRVLLQFPLWGAGTHFAVETHHTEANIHEQKRNLPC